jgi:hypothetical protein
MRKEVADLHTWSLAHRSAEESGSTDRRHQSDVTVALKPMVDSICSHPPSARGSFVPKIATGKYSFERSRFLLSSDSHSRWDGVC